MQTSLLFSRHGCSRGVSFTCVHLLAACSLVLTALPSAFAGITSTGNVTPNPVLPDQSSLYVGKYADGTLLIDGGSEVDGGSTCLGNWIGATGTLTVEGTGTHFTAWDMTVGDLGNGTFELGGGATSSVSRLEVAGNYESQSSISVDGLGTMLNVSSFMSLGEMGHATMSITGGATVSSFWSYLGAYGTGVMTVDGAGSMWTNTYDLTIGQRGSGTLNITNGAQMSTGGYAFSMGEDSYSSGVLTVAGAGSSLTTSSYRFDVGDYGNGVMTISDGGQVSSVNASIGYHGTGTVTVDGPGSVWNNTSTLYVGESGDGSLAITNGGQVNSGASYIAYSSLSMGSAIVDGADSTWNIDGDLTFGRGNRFVPIALTISNGGQVNCHNATIRTALADSSVTVDGPDSLLTASGDLYVGSVGKGMLHVNHSARVEAAGATFVGISPVSTSRLTFDNGTLDTGTLLASPLFLQGQGTINTHGLVSDIDLVFDQTHGSQQQFILNSEPGQNVVINLDRTSAGGLGAGYTGNGTLTIADDQQIESAFGYLGYGYQSNGVATVDGAGTVWNCLADLYVGYYGTGSLTVSGGAQVIAGGSTWLGQGYAASQGSIVFDSGSLDTNTLLASSSDLLGQGVINTHGLVGDIDLVFDQMHPVHQQLILNSEPGQNVTINLDQDATGGLGVGWKGGGSLIIRDGVTIESAFGYVGYGQGSTGTATVSGAGTTWNCHGYLLVGYRGAGTLDILDGAQVNCGYLSMEATSEASADILVDGAGSVLTVSGTSTSWVKGDSNSLTVTNGARVVAYQVDVEDESRVTGDGQIIGDLVNGGHVAPGQSPGTLYIDGNYTQKDDGTLDIELADGVCDLLQINKAAWLNGTLSVTLSDGFVPSPGELFTILTASSITGTFETELLPSLDGGYLDVIYNSNSVVLTVLVPEPASLLLLLTGGTLLMRRRDHGRLMVTACAHLALTCGLALTFSPSAFAGVATTGDVSPDPTTTTTNDDLYVGNTVDGSLSIDGGSGVVSKDTYLGYAAGATGIATVDGTGSTLDLAYLIVASVGSGELRLTNGGVVSGTDAFLGGTFSNSAGTVIVNGEDSLLTLDRSLYIGNGGPGELVIENKGHVFNGQFGIIGGPQSSTAGTVRVSGSESNWTISKDLDVGTSGHGILLIESGGSVDSAGCAIAAWLTATGSVTVTGEGSTWRNSRGIAVAGRGSGHLTIADRASVLNTSVAIATSDGSTGVVEVTGLGTTWTNSSTLSVGSIGSGTLLISAGGYVSNARSSIIGKNTGSTGQVTVTGEGSTWNAGDDMHVGSSGNGTLQIQDHGTVSAASATIGELSGAVGQITVDGSGSSLTLVSDLAVGGAGQGTLNITHGGKISASTIHVGAAGQIAGDGVLTGNVSNNGHVSPGQSPGTLHIDGDYTQQADSTLDIELAAGVCDLLDITGAAVLDGALDVTLFDNFVPSLGESFMILTASSITGTFETELLPSLDGGYLDVIYNSDSVELTVLVPEPGVFAIVLLTLCLVRGRSRSGF